jgi:hypothetical protein
VVVAGGVVGVAVVAMVVDVMMMMVGLVMGGMWMRVFAVGFARTLVGS